MKFNKREFSLELAKKDGKEIIHYPELNNAIVIIGKNKKGYPTLTAFSGKRTKADLNYYFMSEESLNNKLESYLKRIQDKIDYKNERKETKKREAKEALANLKVGDIFDSSWGYEQTNVDFYQVISIKGSSATFREIAHETVKGSEYSHGMACEVLPVKDSFVENAEPFTKRITGNHISLNSFSSMSKWDGRAKYMSWYY